MYETTPGRPSPTYENAEFAAPAPVARARVTSASAATLEIIPMLLDTGAEVSVVPRSVLLQLGLEPDRSSLRLQMYDGRQFEADIVQVSVDLLHFRFRGTFVVADSTYGIVGRNILNLLVLTLDGPQQRWSV